MSETATFATHLQANLAVLRRALQGEPAQPERQALRELEATLPLTPPLLTLQRVFNLSDFERDMLLLCAAVELDATFGDLICQQIGIPSPTLSLALATLPDAHWDAITPQAPLRRWQLIKLGNGDTLTARPLSIDERILHFMIGTPAFDAQLEGVMSPVKAATLTGRFDTLATRISTQITHETVIHMTGHDTLTICQVLATAFHRAGYVTYRMTADTIPATIDEREGFARRWEREAALRGAALIIDVDDTRPDLLRNVSAWFGTVQGMMAVSSRDLFPHEAHSRDLLRLTLPSLAHDERIAAWRQALGDFAGQLNGTVETIAGQFDLAPTAINLTGATVRSEMMSQPDADLSAIVWAACRVQSRPQLDDLAQRIETIATWDDIVLPDMQHALLREMAAQVRLRHTVYHDWGFGAMSARGLGISALFAGASGTGKTMAAEVIANDLQLDLYRIDLSAVVSKYIGETEKHLRRIFDAAERGGAILLFDEADALFGKRSEVKDSHDRHANIEVSYLLQRMEAYQGLAILTTNMKDALDDAFLRRIRFIVPFDFPTHTERARIWSQIFPSQTPTDGLDAGKLAQMNIAGGSIRNIALRAAFMAAATHEPVSMNHILRAAQNEYAKQGKSLANSEVRGWLS